MCDPGATMHVEREVDAMSIGGGGGGEDAFLIGPIMEWWDKHTAKRDAKRAAKLEAKAARKSIAQATPTDDDGKASSDG